MSEIDYNLIERFFERELTAEELSQFNQRLEKDTSFESQVTKYEFALQTSTDIYMPEAKIQKQQLRKRWKQQQEKLKSNTKQHLGKRLLAIAASILMLIAASWYFFSTPSQSIGTSILLARQTQVMENFDIAERGNAQSLEVLQAYENGHYDKVISMTTQIGSFNVDEQLLRGRAFIKLGNFKKGILSFEKVISQQHIKQDEALWNLALIYFQLGKFEKSKSYLQQIITDNFKTKEKAKVILEQMDKD